MFVIWNQRANQRAAPLSIYPRVLPSTQIFENSIERENSHGRAINSQIFSFTESTQLLLFAYLLFIQQRPRCIQFPLNFTKILILKKINLNKNGQEKVDGQRPKDCVGRELARSLGRVTLKISSLLLKPDFFLFILSELRRPLRSVRFFCRFCNI